MTLATTLATSINVNGIEYVEKSTVTATTTTTLDRDVYAENSDGLPYVIVRCLNAGVHAGYLKGRSSITLTLVNSRRLWRWWSKFTLSALAVEGPLATKMTEQKYSMTVPLLDLTGSDVCEVIYCSERAREAIEAIPAHPDTGP